jgi:hypothetical protein
MRPVQAVGMAEAQSSKLKRTLAPNLSHAGPSATRTKIVVLTLAIEEVQTSSLLMFKSCWISESRGVRANQTKKATKKDHLFKRCETVELECLRNFISGATEYIPCAVESPHVRSIKVAVDAKGVRLLSLNVYEISFQAQLNTYQILISFALSSCSGSTAMVYELYFFHTVC